METVANTRLYVHAHAHEHTRMHTRTHTINSIFICNFKNPTDEYNFMYHKQ